MPQEVVGALFVPVGRRGVSLWLSISSTRSERGEWAQTSVVTVHTNKGGRRCRAAMRIDAA